MHSYQETDILGPNEIIEHKDIILEETDSLIEALIHYFFCYTIHNRL